MENTVPTSPVAPPRRLPLFLLGGLLFILGPVIYFIQFRMQNLGVPWYIPILATIGVLCLAISLWQRRGIVRFVVFLLLILICGCQWFLFLVGTKLPPYHGPAEAGRPVPAFATTLTDGKEFTDRDLANGTPSVMVFFRGRW